MELIQQYLATLEPKGLKLDWTFDTSKIMFSNGSRMETNRSRPTLHSITNEPYAGDGELITREGEILYFNYRKVNYEIRRPYEMLTLGSSSVSPISMQRDNNITLNMEIYINNTSLINTFMGETIGVESIKLENIILNRANVTRIYPADESAWWNVEFIGN